MHTFKSYIVTFITSAAVGLVGFAAELSFAQAPFYQGKTITIAAGTAAGGIGDNRVKAVTPFLRKYIPGNPAILVQYMDGGGGRQVGNHMFRVAKPDGLTIGAFSSAVIGMGILRDDGVLYDIDKFFYLGSPESTSHNVFYTRREAGLNALEKLRAASGVKVGGRTVGHSAYTSVRLFTYFLGLKDPKFIPGYSATELDAALLRGEVDARANTATSVIHRNPDWLDKGLMDFHAILEVPKGFKFPRFTHLPEIESFAKNDKERKLITLARVFRLTGAPYVMAPGTPKDRVEVVQEAMRKTLKDPEFLREHKKIVGEEADPLMPEELTKAIQDTPREAEIIDLYKLFSGAAPLPPR